MVAERLKELEREGVIRRSVYAETPVRIEYELTDKGLALREVLMALNNWAVRWDQSAVETPQGRT
jgi:DNA-binding HxlR family transcriptional regulator